VEVGVETSQLLQYKVGKKGGEARYIVSMKTDAVDNYKESLEQLACPSCETQEGGDWAMCECCSRWIHAKHSKGSVEGLLHIKWRRLVSKDKDELKKIICSDCMRAPLCYNCSCLIPASKGVPCWHVFAVVRGKHSRNTLRRDINAIHPQWRVATRMSSSTSWRTRTL
jgi:hypothetical protein